MKEIIGAIDIGSNALRMKIGEIDVDGNFREIDNIRKVISLGHDSFNNGYISQATTNKVCKVLKSFKHLLETYHVENYVVNATSAVREAGNKDYFTEQVRLSTGINIKTIDNSEEQFLTKKAVKYKLDNYTELIQEGAIIVAIGAGSIQVTMFIDGTLVSSQNVKMGALRIKEILGTLERETLKYHKLLDEFISVNLEGLDFFTNTKACKHFIAVGGEINVIESIIMDRETYITDLETLSRVRFRELYEKLRMMSTEEIMNTYGLKVGRANVIVPSMMLFEKILSAGNFEEIITPNISLTDGIIRDIYEKTYLSHDSYNTHKDIISNSRIMAKKFYYNEKHNDYIEDISAKLFDELKAVHGMHHEKLLLQVATVFHDIGKYIGFDDHEQHSYNIVSSLEIVGLPRKKVDLIAIICLYHGQSIPSVSQDIYSDLSIENRLIVAKLSTIISVAEALDRSHKQKIDIYSIKLTEDKLVLKGTSRYNTKLEEWTFKAQADFFQQVFGIKPVLKIKKEI